MIEPEHLLALWAENQVTIKDAENIGSSSTAAAFTAQQAAIERALAAPAVSWAAELGQGQA